MHSQMDFNLLSVSVRMAVMLPENQTKRILKSGGVTFGTMVRSLGVNAIVPLLATSGWDYIVVDTEHSAFNPETIRQLTLTATYEKLDCLVRVPGKDYHLLSQPLDFGAAGLVIPLVETKEEAEHIVESTKYHPLGHRGASTASVSLQFSGFSTEEYIEWANREILIAIQLETERGIENADEILATEGIDAVMIGPFDLSQSMGIPGQMEDPRMIQAIQRVIDLCQRFEVAPGIHLQKVAAAQRWLDAGMTFVTYQYDSKFFLSRSKSAVEELRSLIPAE